MGHAVLGRKLGMTQIWDSDGTRMAITLIETGPVTVTRVKRADGVDGYNAVQIAFEPIEERKLTKPELGVFKKLGIAPHRHLREFRVSDDEVGKYEVGMTYATDFLKPGSMIDVTGTSKGRGFAGVIKRYGMHGADAGHGAHEAFRHPGTGGAGSATPGRVPRGRKRPGQYGNKRSTVQNLFVVNVDRANNLLYVQGAVPGTRGSMVQVNESVKNPD